MMCDVMSQVGNTASISCRWKSSNDLETVGWTNNRKICNYFHVTCIKKCNVWDSRTIIICIGRWFIRSISVVLVLQQWCFLIGWTGLSGAILQPIVSIVLAGMIAKMASKLNFYLFGKRYTVCRPRFYLYRHTIKYGEMLLDFTHGW